MAQRSPAIISKLAHVGIRVHNLERSRAFYSLLGFNFVVGPVGPEPVAIMDHPNCPLELNLVLNAAEDKTPNVLMDVPVKKPGYTHIALVVDDCVKAGEYMEAHGFPITEKVNFPGGGSATFIRDPDGITIELHQYPDDKQVGTGVRATD